MTALGYADALILGIVQGLTEFLPISSSGHLTIAQRWLALEPGAAEMLMFNMLTHMGTLVAVAAVFARPIQRFVIRLTSEANLSQRGNRLALRFFMLAVFASMPTAVVGLLLKSRIESAFEHPKWISAFLVITGVLLAGSAIVRRGKRGWRRITWWQALLVGIAQAGAMLPGISRSGATICVATYCGWRRRWAAEFSFLLAVPAITGGTVLKLLDTFQLPADRLAEISWGPIALGAVTALVVGLVALKLLLTAVQRAKLHYFALYCWAFSGLIVLTPDTHFKRQAFLARYDEANCPEPELIGRAQPLTLIDSLVSPYHPHE